MLNKFYEIIFQIEQFNPHGVKLYDMSRKLKGEINGKKVIIFKAKAMNGDEWYVQMMVSDKGKYEEYKYEDHLLVNGNPNIFTLLSKGNLLIDKWLENSP
jgi:hypothetical protein